MWRTEIRKEHYGLVLIVAIAAVSLLHNLSRGSLPPFDDTTYALISKTILKTGDWITMRWLDIPYFFSGKPPLNFWLTALFYKMFGISEFSSRLSTAIHGIAGIAVTYFIGALYSRRVGVTAAAFLLSFPDYFRLSQSAMLEVPLTVHMSLSLLLYLLACRNHKIKYYCLAGMSCGLAIMTKSQVGIAPLLVIGIFHLMERHPETLLTKHFGVVVASGLTVALPWHLWEYLLHGEKFVTSYLFGTATQTTDVLLAAQRSSPIFYLQVLYTNDPIHLFVFIASLPLLVALAVRKSRESLLLLIYILFLFVLFSSFNTRMPWYITPAFPAIAVSSALLLSRLQEKDKFGRIVSLVLAGAFLVQMGFLWKQDHLHLRGDPDLKQIVLDFRSKSSPDDVLFCYGFGEPVNTGPFYGDRKVVFLTSSKDDLRAQIKVEDYLQAGLVQFVQDEDELVRRVCSTRDRHVIFRSDMYQALKDKLKPTDAKPIAENRSYTIIRFSCAR
jgi:4-amino-4-deoxy-L-arabinose transferase-like glycosyltransferase